MLTISKPLSSGQAHTYHQRDFSNSQDNYYTEGEKVRGEWHGKLAAHWGLKGDVREEHFARLAYGQHPLSGEPLVRHRAAYEYVNGQGDTVRTMDHRAGWDATFSAPKSVSLTGLVGRAEEVRQAHREAVNAALDELEKYVQARIGGNHPPDTTGKWAAAKFEHDSSRPVDGYAAPQLHTHVVIFNVTELDNGETRALQPHELYRSQQYATAVYRDELTLQLKRLGYQIEQSPNGAPEIKGYTQGYLDASSPRRQQIKEHLDQEGIKGAEAAEIAAHRTRDAKIDVSHEEMQRCHQDMAEKYGNQPERVVQEAQARARQIEPRTEEQIGRTIREAVHYAVEKNFEREAVSDERELMRDALKRAMGEASVRRIQQQLNQDVEDGGLIQRESPGGVGRSFTTHEMIALERDNIRFVRSTQDQYPPLASSSTRRAIEHEYEHLSSSQHRAVQEVLSNRDQITALEGIAGAGKTTSLSAIRVAAERESYNVEGFAPTSRAAHKLGEAGILSNTLQHHLALGPQADAGERHLYVLDESSLASTRQINDFLHRLGEQDRVLLVGDARQHEAVEAGRPYYQLQQAGMRAAHLDEIVRQKDPALKEVVEQLARGEVHAAIGNLDRQGRVQQIENRDERFQAMVQDYARHPQATLVVSPDNQSRRKLNALIHHELQERGQVRSHEQTFRVLEARQELTGADRAWAEQYVPGDVLRYSRGSRVVGVNAGEYATVANTDAKENMLTVEHEDGQHVTYDPRRLQGVSVYREAERDFAEGDRVQFTAPSKELHVANRELGTIVRLDERGDIAIHTDSGRLVEFQLKDHPHLDYGYAVTSHSSQGQTADRVLIHADTEESAHLVNSRMAYVAVSRGRYDAQIYTNDKSELAEHLTRDVSHRTAVQTGQEQESDVGQKISPSSVGHDTAQDHGVSPQSQGPSAAESQGQAVGE
jgi:conjugative relaxase-like TrwC/TraI family protein